MAAVSKREHRKRCFVDAHADRVKKISPFRLTTITKTRLEHTRDHCTAAWEHRDRTALFLRQVPRECRREGWGDEARMRTRASLAATVTVLRRARERCFLTERIS